MLFAAIKNLFDIDNVGNRWGVRFLYMFTVILNAAIHFNPWADTDFTPLMSWTSEVYGLTEYDADKYEALLSAVPLSTGNIIYLATLLLGYFILLASALIYAGVFVREYRKERLSSDNTDEAKVINYAVNHIPDQPIKPIKLVLRVLLLLLIAVLFSFPILFTVSYFALLLVIGLPFIFTAPVAYLSGDTGFFKSFPHAAKLSVRYYFIILRSMSLIFIVAVILSFAVPLLQYVSVTAYYIVHAAVTTWLWLSFARLAGISYCTMKEFPLKGNKRPYAI